MSFSTSTSPTRAALRRPRRWCPRGGKVVGLTAGFYHIVSRYGTANAQSRADIRVDAGKLTEATLFQKAARLTLKLVQNHGGEAVADTVWSVQDSSGDTVVGNMVSAFPSVILAAGDYTATVRHAGKNSPSPSRWRPATTATSRCCSTDPATA